METRAPVLLRWFIFIGCCIFALNLPFDFPLKNIGISIPFIKSSLELEIVILLILWEMVIFFRRSFIIETAGLLVPISVFFIIHIFSSIFPSELMIWSLKYTFRFFGLGLIFFIIINFIREEKDLDYFINCLFIGAGLAATFVFIQYFYPYLLIPLQHFFDDAEVSPNKIRGLFGWPTNMSVYLGSFILPLISRLIYKPNKGKLWEKIFYALLLLIIILALIISKKRGWILGMSCGLSIFWLLYLIKERNYLVIWLTIIILGIAIFFGTGKFILNDLEPSQMNRWTLMKETLGFIAKSPFRGIGADMFIWKSTSHCRTHNIFLEPAVNLGLFGLVSFLLLLYSLFKVIGRGIFKGPDFKNYYIQLGIISFLASFLGHGLVDYFWSIPGIVGLFWALAGIGVCASMVRDK